MSPSPPALPSEGRNAGGLRRAVQHVKGLWFPVNGALLSRIQGGLKEGTYDLDIDFLINDLKGDFALFTYCLREMNQLLTARTPPTAITSLSIRDLFAKVGIKGVTQILSVDPAVISRHLPTASSPTQVERIEAAMISASTAEVLAERHGVDAITGYSTALLRQLGLTLIAFNYPTAFRRAMAESGVERSLDQALSDQLGFSPAMLGGAIVQEWRAVDPAVRHAVGSEGGADGKEGGASNRSVSSLRSLCEIGEALTRVAHPEQYPTAMADWRSAKAHIERSLGHEAVHLISERTRENCSQYFKMFPGLMKLAPQFSPESRLHEHHRERLVERNPFILGCLPPLRAALTEFYSHIGASGDIRENLQVLIQKVLPVSGFSGVAIYTVDPTARTLGARLRFGRIQLHQLGAISLDRIATTRDPVALAYECSAPLCEEGTVRSELATIAGSLGGAHGMGVAYCEYHVAVFDELEGGSTTHFKALRVAIHDALGVPQPSE